MIPCLYDSFWELVVLCAVCGLTPTPLLEGITRLVLSQTMQFTQQVRVVVLWTKHCIVDDQAFRISVK